MCVCVPNLTMKMSENGVHSQMGTCVGKMRCLSPIKRLSDSFQTSPNLVIIAIQIQKRTSVCVCHSKYISYKKKLNNIKLTYTVYIYIRVYYIYIPLLTSHYPIQKVDLIPPTPPGTQLQRQMGSPPPSAPNARAARPQPKPPAQRKPPRAGHARGVGPDSHNGGDGFRKGRHSCELVLCWFYVGLCWFIRPSKYNSKIFQVQVYHKITLYKLAIN